ncbi:Conserved hypothetical protein CHP00255 [Stieleria maiorica]|uniref:YicC family protein n=1 Tax=Stieleria maiorica TaxID=2795974 RepID=A0A5B9MP83_9BACT|nr:YicC/YloC family endoribonuclease [Stieleria maiorica]QEG00678.1 Conserved hypothetical protein CHP00255 [Stieleria maiorica]
MPSDQSTIAPAGAADGAAGQARSMTGQIRSMTGQGRAAGPTDIGTLTVELRTVNNRGFKCSIRTPDALSGSESLIESVVRKYLHRGSVNLSINVERQQGQTPVQINGTVLAGYIRQCQTAIDQAGAASTSQVSLDVGSLMTLPGVLTGSLPEGDEAEKIFQQTRRVVIDALENLVAMRQQEGAHMAETLLGECATIAAHVRSIESLAPQAAESYRVRLEGKVKRVLAEYDAEVNAVDLLREVQVYADKADVSEEVTRLDSHLKLFQSVLRGETPDGEKNATKDEPVGRKLDFIIQEMFRETNTIGSKSAHADVSAIVVEIKCAIERMRELVQNLE